MRERAEHETIVVRSESAGVLVATSGGGVAAERAGDLARPVPTCAPSDVLSAVAQTLWMGRLDCVPVVVAGGGDPLLVGVLNGRDVDRAAAAHCRPLHALRVRDAMTIAPLTCRAEDTVEEALRLMRRHAYAHLPVVDDHGRFAGLLSLAESTSALAERAPAPNVNP